ncbi:flagellar basal body P-ring formation chaperone FlgA [Helicobacter cetorum]|uniref:flagellar basal body P-ring formation chaperone FlgA n=1 Tax=Helicobacter cetorum TaxID=138563 RepID=UPI000CF1A6EB|nr:flagellar basal body P-ring formation chaperone FlgA [Helicobacter cetorum]
MKILVVFVMLLKGLLALDLSALKEDIKGQYLKAYKTLDLKIDAIELKVPERFANAVLESYDLGSKDTLKKDGVVFLNLKIQNEPNLRLPVRYSVIGSIQAFKSSSVIKKDENITSNNTIQTRINFGSVESPLIIQSINQASAKVYIAPNTILTASKIQPLIIVRKNDMIMGVLKEGRITLEINLQALENGSLNQIIQAKNLESNKILKVRVLNNSKVQIL